MSPKLNFTITKRVTEPEISPKKSPQNYWISQSYKTEFVKFKSRRLALIALALFSNISVKGQPGQDIMNICPEIKAIQIWNFMLISSGSYVLEIQANLALISKLIMPGNPCQFGLDMWSKKLLQPYSRLECHYKSKLAWQLTRWQY